MASLGNLYHDFPRLAKQSGFHFQLHKGKVNWSEIENLDLNDIIENENYKLLEQNLSNVVNCNLEKEYDLKILDQNFVKLIKLAQLGVDYLSYFEIYLDKCVILLQEQLIAFKEECDSLKRKESKKIKKKKKTQSYQCEKCEKVFISDVYLKFHEKRRHSNPDNLDNSHRKFLSNGKENEQKQFSISTQTLFLDEMLTVTNEHENENSLIKIKKLEQEIQELKERLKKAETTLTVKTEASKSNEFSSFNVTDAKQYDSILLFLPFFLTQSNDSYEKSNSECQTSIPRVAQPNCTVSHLIKAETFNNEPVPENFSHISSESENKVEKEKEETKLILPTESFDSFQNLLKEEIKIFKCEKENADRNTEEDIVTYLNKPLPAPRKLKKEFGKQIRTESEIEGLCKTSRKEIEGCSNFSTPDKSTTMKNPNEENISDISEETKRSFCKIKKSEANSVESLDSQKSISAEPQFKSFIKKIVTNSSPKLRKISENIKKSLSSRNDFVSTIVEKDSDNVNLRTVVEGINNRLRRLGVDPEWSGIPKKTMKQKLNVLKHRRRVFSKANPMYFVVRQNLEKKIFQKLKTSLGEKKTILSYKLHNQRSMNSKRQPTENAIDKDISELIKIESSALNITNIDSDSVISDSEQNFRVSHRTLVEERRRSFNDQEKKIQFKKDTEFDFSVFQVGKTLNTTTNERKNEKKCNQIKERGADLDSESDFSDNLSFKTLNISSNDQQNQTTNLNTAKHQLEFSRTRKENEGQCILKVGEEDQSRLSLNAQKRFFFASYPSGIEELTESPTDDFRSLKSDWEKDLG